MDRPRNVKVYSMPAGSKGQDSVSAPRSSDHAKTWKEKEESVTDLSAVGEACPEGASKFSAVKRIQMARNYRTGHITPRVHPAELH
mmetsp:Transcript_28812/g.60348  ORF Transcript_28812/g.60348 Transcript_28812/m.60348 type:complete len:86 (-) Transcript_28812:902-1159(-)